MRSRHGGYHGGAGKSAGRVDGNPERRWSTAGSIAARACFCVLLATPARDFSAMKIGFPLAMTSISGKHSL